MSIEAMKQAIEALEINLVFLKNVKPFKGQEDLAADCISMTEEMVVSLRQAIAEAEKQEPVAWKLVPIEPTEEMLKAMDECSTEGYDERLLAGHAASVYMAAVDVAPSPPQRQIAKQALQPLTDEQIMSAWDEALGKSKEAPLFERMVNLVRAIEAAHGIKGDSNV